MCMQAGDHRFKFAVNNKTDFLKIFNFSWPAKMEGCSFEVMKPRSLPDCFSLVVRYIPEEIRIEDAKLEIMKAIPTAVAFSSIKYQQRQRPSYDIRFSVTNIDHYETALEIGRLSIGHHYLPLTHFYMGCRLTYCTACWRIDHSRNQCQANVCCRKCLEPYESGVKHFCSDNKIKCAQCGGAHFSLDPACPIIHNYKIELKRAVEEALNKGTIKRTIPGETSQSLNRQGDDFPVLKAANVGGGPGWHSPPVGSSQLNSTQLTSTQLNPFQLMLTKEVNEIGKSMKALSDSLNRIETKLCIIDKRIDVIEKRSMLHSNSITTIIDSIQVINKWVHANNSEKSKLKKKIDKLAEDLQNWRQKIKEDGNESCSIPTSPHHPITTTSISTNNTDNKNDGETDLAEDQSMSSPNHGV
jgi:hypothetical protein